MIVFKNEEVGKVFGALTDLIDQAPDSLNRNVNDQGYKKSLI